MFLFSIFLHAIALVRVRTRLVLTQLPPTLFFFQLAPLGSKYLTCTLLQVATGWSTLWITCRGVCSNYRGHPKHVFISVKAQNAFSLMGLRLLSQRRYSMKWSERRARSTRHFFFFLSCSNSRQIPQKSDWQGQRRGGLKLWNLGLLNACHSLAT